MSLETTIGGLNLKGCVYNASGPRSGSVEDLMIIGKSDSCAIVSKSCTPEKREGNPLPRFIKGIDMGNQKVGSMNSEGLPNHGIDYYIEAASVEKIVSACADKPYIVSISGHTVEENCAMIAKIMVAKEEGIPIAGIELNLACPNIPGESIISYDIEQMDEVLKRVTDVMKGFLQMEEAKETQGTSQKLVFGVKLAPLLDGPMIRRVVELLLNYSPTISFCVVSNSLPNALFIDTEHECCSIRGKNGFGGLGGSYVKPIALANIRAIYTTLKELNALDVMDIVGVGGIFTGEDAFQALLCGASAVQLATVHWSEGADCFRRVSSELQMIMKKKGYLSVREFHGQLKPYTEHTCQVSQIPSSLNMPNTLSRKSSFIGFHIGNILVIIVFAMLLWYIFHLEAKLVSKAAVVKSGKHSFLQFVKGLF